MENLSGGVKRSVMGVTNLGIKEKKAYGYFGFIPNHKYSDIAYIELMASRNAPLDEADILAEYDAISDDDYIVENYKPEQVLDAIKKAMKLADENWEEVKLVFHLTDKETKSRSYFSLAVRSYWGNRKEVSFSIGVTIKKKERE